ncbi:hypothetical protein L7F22_028957 [Adiantum nelumboides]|nr:hypothetical protein [Adiantum nelumboides]
MIFVKDSLNGVNETQVNENGMQNEFADVENRRPKGALVVFNTGIVDTSPANLLLKPDSPKGPWKVYGVARRAWPKWFVNTQIDNVQCDFLDETDTQTKIAPLKDVTHLFWVVWTWSIHRPNVIFGFCPCNLINILKSLAVYACICKHEGLPSLFPGDSTYWEQFGEVSDADLVAEQELWAALDSSAKNQVFIISDGDVFNYKWVWSLLAEQFDIDVPDYSDQLTSLSKAMKAKGPVWDATVQKHGLVPTKVGKIANWRYVDGLLNTNLLGIPA